MHTISLLPNKPTYIAWGYTAALRTGRRKNPGIRSNTVYWTLTFLSPPAPQDYCL